MKTGIYKVREIANEPILSYKAGSKEKLELKKTLSELKEEILEIPLIINGEEIKTDNVREIRIPHNHKHIIARYHLAGEKELSMAIEAAKEAKKAWETIDMEHRMSIFLKAAELIAGPYRAKMNAVTMLGQSKTVFQAEIDSACELIDFLRYNVKYMEEIYSEQPNSTSTEWNRLDFRPLEGYVLAITPFNFTAIGGNLSTAPVMLGNVAIWKPSNNAVYSNYLFMKILEESGLPKGVINFVPSIGSDVEEVLIKNKDLAGIHFTGSSKVFENIYKVVGENIHMYRSFPRLVGETGGKDFIFAHNSCDIDALSVAFTRGSFEYQGQKCSAASRGYVPKSIWNELKDKLIDNLKDIKIGDVENFTNFMSAVIDQKAFDKIEGYIDYAKSSDEAEIIFGGGCDDSEGYFVEPTVIVTSNPRFKTMEEEIFGPVMTIYVYDDENFEETLTLCDETSPYGLTGAILAKDREIIEFMQEKLYHTAGNFYINDKPTGAVVGQQPFGGGRKSGTNDKAGSKYNLLRWINIRNTKENFNPPHDYKYDFMEEE